MTLWFDRSRLADQDLLRDYLSVAMLLSRPSRRELLAAIGG